MGKEYVKAAYCHPSYLTYMQSTLCKMWTRWSTSWISGRNINNLRYAMEKAMASHSSTLAWKIPWTEEPARLQSVRSLRVGHDWATSLWLFTFMHCRRKWQPTLVFLPGESHRQKSLVGYCSEGCKESDMTEQVTHSMVSCFSRVQLCATP